MTLDLSASKEKLIFWNFMELMMSMHVLFVGSFERFIFPLYTRKGNYCFNVKKKTNVQSIIV